MPALNVEGVDWSGAYSRLLGRHTIHVSGPEIIAAALSVGAPLLHIPFSTHAMNLALYKALGLACAVDHSGSTLVRPADYPALDPTEKANISFWTGMTFAALVAEHCLSIPSVWHVSSMVRSGRAMLQPQSGVVADLLGQDQTGNWHVIEAKARQSNPPAAGRASWKRQTTTIAWVDGRVPATRSYCLTKVGDPYAVELVDPPEPDANEHQAVAVTTHDVIRGYYEPFRAWLASSDDAPAADRAFEIDRGPSLTVKRAAYDAATQLYWFVGLRSDVLEALRQPASTLSFEPRSLSIDQGHVRADGIAIVGAREAIIT